jgi:hypothetical protein
MGMGLLTVLVSVRSLAAVRSIEDNPAPPPREYCTATEHSIQRIFSHHLIEDSEGLLGGASLGSDRLRDVSEGGLRETAGFSFRVLYSK